MSTVPTPVQKQTAKPEKPTTVRLGAGQIKALDRIREATNLTRNAVIGLAIDAFVTSVELRGNLPTPKLTKMKKGGTTP